MQWVVQVLGLNVIKVKEVEVMLVFIVRVDAGLIWGPCRSVFYEVSLLCWASGVDCNAEFISEPNRGSSPQ